MAGGANQTLRERRNGGSSSNHKNINIIEHFRSPSNLYFDDSVIFDFFSFKGGTCQIKRTPVHPCL